MKQRTSSLDVLALATLIALGASACDSNPPQAETAPEPVAMVTVAPLERQTLTETVVAYGTVIPAPGAAQTVNVPFECRVRAVLVTPGQEVVAGEPLLEIEPSPDARELIAQARTARIAEEALTAATEQRYELGLAIEDELSQRRQGLEDARRRERMVASWLELERPRSPARAIVSATLVGEGAIVAPGQPLLELALEHRFEVRLGVEPEDSGFVEAGNEVRFAPLGRSGATPSRGSVRSVARQVSADTRLVDLLVVPQEGSASLLLGEAIRGEIEVESAVGLVVPRSALVVEGDHWLLFTVEQDRAVEHRVTLGIETDERVEIRGPGLAEGDSVVVTGNTVLSDGARVSVQEDGRAAPPSPGTTAPATTAPATTAPATGAPSEKP